MEWLGENWILVLLIGGMLVMHLFMHRGHGGHGGGRKSEAAPEETTAPPDGKDAPRRD